MKPTNYVGLALVTLLTFFSAVRQLDAQQVDASAQQNISGSAPHSALSRTSSTGAHAGRNQAKDDAGVMLAGDANGQGSGTLSAPRRNVHLDGGTQTQMVLGIASASK